MSSFETSTSEESDLSSSSDDSPVVIKPSTSFIPSLKLGKMREDEKSKMSLFDKDGVSFVHGVNSLALSDIATSGFQSMAERLEQHATDSKLLIKTVEDRKKVVDSFPKLSTGEGGNTLDAWQKDRSQPIAKGISLFRAEKAKEAAHYAKLGVIKGMDNFPVILGLDKSFNLQSPRIEKNVGHPISEGSISPKSIQEIYVPKGRSKDTNKILTKAGSLKRAKSYPDLFK